MVRQQFAKLRPGNWSCGFDPHTLRHEKYSTPVEYFSMPIPYRRVETIASIVPPMSKLARSVSHSVFLGSS